MKTGEIIQNSNRLSKAGVRLAIVIPCYNEEDMLPITVKKLLALFEDLLASERITNDSRICFVDDGSRDGTWEVIRHACEESPFVTGIKLTRNFGHQNALIAGMFSLDAQAVITMDADLQDDLNVIVKMLDEYHNSKDVVYGIRKTRQEDNFFKRQTAHAFYRIMRWMGVDIIPDHADFRLISARGVRWLKGFPEVELFLRGLVPQLTSNAAFVYYERHARLCGKTKYPLSKMLSFAWRGITSSTAFPLRLVTLTGFFIFSVSIAMAGRAVFVKLLTNQAVTGWASTVVPIYLLGGLQILCLGVIGEYVSKIFMEAKHRPRFLIDRQIGGYPPRPKRRIAHGQRSMEEVESETHLVNPD